MSQTKTTRAFRTISEAGDELGLQPHVLRFWESKFSQIKPIKRGGGRRFYRPEDIEFIRGIKKLLHDEKHPIKDVQKLIQKKGASRIVELGRSVEKAARETPVAETDLLPERIKSVDPAKSRNRIRMPVLRPRPTKTPPKSDGILERPSEPITSEGPETVVSVAQPAEPPTQFTAPKVDTKALEDALESLQSLKSKLSDFRKAGSA